jgi:hypothetical protein
VMGLQYDSSESQPDPAVVVAGDANRPRRQRMKRIATIGIARCLLVISPMKSCHATTEENGNLLQ